jgi:hypothetical protein
MSVASALGMERLLMFSPRQSVMEPLLNAASSVCYEDTEMNPGRS